MTELLLDLATVVARDTIRIRTKKDPDGKLYELLNIDELGPFEYHRFLAQREKAGKADQKWFAGQRLTASEKSIVRKATGEILKLLMPALEPAVLAELSDVQRSRIIAAWLNKHGSDGAAEGETPAQESPSTTAGSSRASKPSTAATRKRGSTRRRGR